MKDIYRLLIISTRRDNIILYLFYLTSKYNMPTGKIYKIVSKNTRKIYIGSTALTLKQRLYQHEHNYKQYKKQNYANVRAFKVMKKGDYKIKLIDKVKYKEGNKTPLLLIEQYWIDKLKKKGKKIVNVGKPYRFTMNDFASDSDTD